MNEFEEEQAELTRGGPEQMAKDRRRDWWLVLDAVSPLLLIIIGLFVWWLW